MHSLRPLIQSRNTSWVIPSNKAVDVDVSLAKTVKHPTIDFSGILKQPPNHQSLYFWNTNFYDFASCDIYFRAFNYSILYLLCWQNFQIFPRNCKIFKTMDSMVWGFEYLNCDFLGHFLEFQKRQDFCITCSKCRQLAWISWQRIQICSRTSSSKVACSIVTTILHLCFSSTRFKSAPIFFWHFAYFCFSFSTDHFRRPLDVTHSMGFHPIRMLLSEYHEHYQRLEIAKQGNQMLFE